MEKYKTYVHTPPHLHKDSAKYFITASTYKKIKILDDNSKQKLLSSLKIACRNYDWTLEDWVIMDNHYHIMVNSPKKGADISKFVSEYHKFTAMFIKKKYPQHQVLPKIFDNYWDTCISYERSYYARLNYIYFNPVKHGYVKKAQDYQWGSYFYRYKEQKEYLERLMEAYPFDKINIKDDH